MHLFSIKQQLRLLRRGRYRSVLPPPLPPPTHYLPLPSLTRAPYFAPLLSRAFHSASALPQKAKAVSRSAGRAAANEHHAEHIEAEIDDTETDAQQHEVDAVDDKDDVVRQLHIAQRQDALKHRQRQLTIQQRTAQANITSTIKAAATPPTNGTESSPAKPPKARKPAPTVTATAGRPREDLEAARAARAVLIATPANLSDVTIVNSSATAQHALAVLTSPQLANRFHAIDTEVADIDPKQQSPVGHGRVTAITVYAGEDVNFGNGPRLFIDCLDSTDGTDMFNVFSDYFANASIRKVFHNYSFDYHVLCNHGLVVAGFAGDTMHMCRLWDTSKLSYSLESLSGELVGRAKMNMKERFAKNKLKQDGSEGLTLVLPPIDSIQRGADRDAWIDYATYDAESTYKLRAALENELRNQPNPALISRSPPPPYGPNMYSFYHLYYVPFAAMLVEMERAGVYVKGDVLAGLEIRAQQDANEAEASFREWVRRYQGQSADWLNISSNQHKVHLFFGRKGEVKQFERDNVEGYIEEGKKKAKKYVDFPLVGLGIAPVQLTKGKGEAAVSVPVLQKLAGKPDSDPPKYGLAYNHFATFGPDSTEADGVEACKALGELCRISALSTTLNTFIIPLQQQLDPNSRIHASLNLNTETGRLSSRRPNLQNQPALEKDVYRVRDAFAAPAGKRLIVADYGQLELRVLAHMTKCRSMMDAFTAGGDFHSRTAMGMYPYIRQAVDRGEVVLEGDGGSGGGAKVERLKDRYASERRKAKVLNFSIAYGKTARGLATDFGTSVEEAEATLAAWYADRPEVKEWQQRTIEEAHRSGYTRTLMGRYRLLKGINSRDRALRGHMERAAINTPIQGGAADIVMMAMLKLHKNERFKQIGWQCILQIHDEVICEGPEESVDEAMTILRHCMQQPFNRPLLVDLSVDAKAEQTWYRAK